MNISEILILTIMMQTLYRTYPLVTSFDLGEVIKGHYIKKIKSWIGHTSLQIYQTLMD